MERKIVIIGLGLIGGSLARAFRKYTDCSVAGIDRDERVAEAALSAGAINNIGTMDDVRNADVVFLCLYPRGCVEWTKAHLSVIRPGCLVTDTCGIKSWICPRMEELSHESGFIFVGGHPMAGRERNGFSAGDADLFQGASYLLVPCGAPRDAVELLRDMVLSLGCARTVETTPQEHDEMIAFTSQLPHVLACAYVKSPQCLKHDGFSAGSYRDVSRVANINEIMWTELFLENRTVLTAELDTLTGHIAEIRDAIAAGDAETLRGLLRGARLIKERLGET
jgi:prephenate dehydrogenase